MVVGNELRFNVVEESQIGRFTLLPILSFGRHLPTGSSDARGQM